mmetsp:Transcript_25240/g.73030  ORF Transcript_25240/g.73030 Transcript_25240/m.73030 type:complete len:255 (-) Transcript_25240:1345-2109(-)
MNSTVARTDRKAAMMDFPTRASPMILTIIPRPIPIPTETTTRAMAAAVPRRTTTASSMIWWPRSFCWRPSYSSWPSFTPSSSSAWSVWAPSASTKIVIPEAVCTSVEASVSYRCVGSTVCMRPIRPVVWASPRRQMPESWASNERSARRPSWNCSNSTALPWERMVETKRWGVPMPMPILSWVTFRLLRHPIVNRRSLRQDHHLVEKVKTMKLSPMRMRISALFAWMGMKLGTYMSLLQPHAPIVFITIVCWIG